MEAKKISMDVPIDDYNWLKDENINMTDLFKEAVKKKRYHIKQKMNPLLFLAAVMGIVFSVALIGIGLTPTPIHIFTRSLLCALGGFLAIVTMLVYIRSKRD